MHLTISQPVRSNKPIPITYEGKRCHFCHSQPLEIPTYGNNRLTSRESNCEIWLQVSCCRNFWVTWHGCILVTWSQYSCRTPRLTSTGYYAKCVSGCNHLHAIANVERSLTRGWPPLWTSPYNPPRYHHPKSEKLRNTQGYMDKWCLCEEKLTWSAFLKWFLKMAFHFDAQQHIKI